MQVLSQKTLTVRYMKPSEVESIAADWAALEGWNPGLHDASAFYAADPKGFFVAEEDGEPAGCISAVRYGLDFGFIGIFIVKPEQRKNHPGFLLARKALETLDGRNAGIEGSPEDMERYQRLGFTLAHHNARYQFYNLGQTRGRCDENAPLVDVSVIPFAELAAYDQRFFPAEREDFLKRWICLPGARALAALNPAGEKIIGYGVLRPCRQGSKIGPLFANDESTAEMLFDALAAHAPEGPVLLDIPEPNEAAQRLVKKNGMKKMFQTARMYNRPAPALPLDNIFGFTSLELG